jgi:hypothetical protein
MIFPSKWIQIDECFAVWRKVSGPRKIAGPVLNCRPTVKYENEDWKASRLSYHLNCDSIPKTPISLKEGIVCHHCDNEWCINPKHLYLGTAKQNTKDIYDRNLTIKHKLSIAKIGNKNSSGKKASEETKLKMSIAKIGNKNKLGKTKRK